MSGMESNGQRLDTWQEIARHLGVTVRTCQKWEKEQSLPVHRLKGDRARVWAHAEELDCWKNSFEARKDTSSNPPDCQIPVSIEPPPERPSRRRWLIGGAAGILGAGCAGFALGRSWHSAVRPVGCDIEGPVLTVFGPGHVPLWGHVFPEVIDKFVLPNDRMQYLFEDLDGDGDLETLYAYQSKSNLYSLLVCFNSRGKVLWEFPVGRTVTDTAGRQFTPPYMIQCFDRYVLPGEGRL